MGDAAAHFPKAAALDGAASKRRTEWRGASTVWREWGQGRPVLLMHGGFGSWTHWVRTIPFLSAGRRVLVPDMPGFGESDMPAEENLLEGIPGALLQGLEELDAISDGIDVVGFSFGTVMAGALAARLHRSHPGALRRLTLAAPAGLGIVTRNFEDLLSLEPGMTEPEKREIHRTNLGIIMFGDKSKIDDEAIDLQIANTSRTRVSGKPYSRSSALIDACRALSVPRIDVVFGDADAYALRNEPAYSEAVRGLHSDTRIYRLPAGHWVQHEVPRDFNTLLGRCLDEG